MSELETSYHFRAALHGFNREDVVAYIEKTSRESEEEIQRLRTVNRQLREELDAAKEEIEKASAYAEAARELEDARRRLSESEAEKRNLMAQIEELENRSGPAAEPAVVQPAETVAAQPDLSEPILPVSDVVPEELAPAKDYAELELAAYRRAEMAERLAKERAQEVYRKVQSVFGTATTKLDTGKSDLDQLTQTIREDVDQMIRLLNNICSSYEDAQASFAAVNGKEIGLS